MKQGAKIPQQTQGLIYLLSDCGVPNATIAKVVQVNPITARKYRSSQVKYSHNETLRRIIEAWAQKEGLCQEAKDLLFQHFIDPYLREIYEELNPIVSWMASPRKPYEKLYQAVFGKVNLDRIILSWFEEQVGQGEYRPTAIKEYIEEKIRNGEELPAWSIAEKVIRGAWESLLPREQKILESYHGLKGGPSEFIVLADCFSISGGRVQQIHRRACYKLRQQIPRLTWAGVGESWEQQAILEKEIAQLREQLAQYRQKMEDIRRLTLSDNQGDVQKPGCPENILETLIADLDFTTRTFHCLIKYGIRTLGDLVQKTKAELLAIRNFGAKSLNEVIEKLAVFNLYL